MSDFRKVCPQCNKTFQDEDALEILTECPEDGTTLVFHAVDPIVGTKLADRYLVEALIGRGATSTVYRALDTTVESPLHVNPAPAADPLVSASVKGAPPATGAFSSGFVAVKVLHPHLSGDAAVVKRLSQEAKSLRDFIHKNVVGMFSLGVTRQGQPFLVMEMVEGQSLLEYMRQNGALSSQLCLSIFDQILDAIGAAHSRGILHRDLKPGNIMLTPDGAGSFNVKLLDFGIAKIVPLQGDTFFRLTQTGEMMGSLLYMSPEQCLEQDWDQRGDIYSLGCVFYEALTARAPLIGRTAFETMNKHLSEMPPPLSVVRPDIRFPRGIEHVVMKMLAKDPLKRYQTAGEARADLRLVAEGKGDSLDDQKDSKAKLPAFKIGILTRSDQSERETAAIVARGDMLAAKLKKDSRQRIVEVAIFMILMSIWAVPLVLAFAYTPNALVSACLFGLLLPFLAAVSAMVVVRLPRIPADLSMVFRPGQPGIQLLPNPAEPGALLLGEENDLISIVLPFSPLPKKVIAPYQRAQAMPMLLLGKADTGKTRLMASLAVNDLDDARKPQFILSPDGALADLTTSWIASHPQGKTMARRVVLLDLDRTATELGISGCGTEAVKDVSERVVEAVEASISGDARYNLTSEQTHILQASVCLLLAADEPLSSLPSFLMLEKTRESVFDKIPGNNGSNGKKNPFVDQRHFIEARAKSDWKDVTAQLIDICYRFPLDAEATALRIFWQNSLLIRESVSKRKVLIVKGSKDKLCPLFFRLVFNEIIKEGRPSARLSDAENYPVVYVDDAEACGIADKFAHSLVAPAEAGIELILSTRSLGNYSSEEVNNILVKVGCVAAFALSHSDAEALKPLCEPNLRKKPGLLMDVTRDMDYWGEPKAELGLFDPLSKVVPDLPQRSYFYFPKALGDKPSQLIAPLFPDIRITEVEWSIVESMRTGWLFG